MVVWTIALLVFTLGFLAYKHPPPIMQKYLPQWLWQSPPEGSQVSKGREAKLKVNDDAAAMATEVTVAVHEPSEAEATPKASASKANAVVPSFSLNTGDDGGENDSPEPKPTLSSFPAANSPQRASPMPMPPPPRPTQSKRQGAPSSLMPPPARPAPNSRVPATAAASLRVPTTGPLPNRGPPVNSQQRVSSSLAPNATVQTPNSRGKILLKPGHSPMDWAALTRSSSSTLSGVSTFQRVTPSQLRSMTGRKGKPAWSSWQGKVYNITPYVDFHPGGGPEIMKCAGRDGERLFMETHPWVNWENMLGACLVGVMVPEGYRDAKGKESEGGLEGLD